MAAQVSYRQFPTLADEEAAPWTFEKVAQLQAELDTVMLADVAS